MNHRPVIRYLLLTVVLLFLVVLAWWVIEGALRQWTHSGTFGQKLETVIQVLCGILSLLSAVTLFWWQRWARPIHLAWAASFVVTAGLSSLVWGPPMPLISLAFVGVALLVAWSVILMMRKSLNDQPNSKNDV